MTHRPTVLVTGGLGYIGRHVVWALLDRSYRVVSLDRAQTTFDVLEGENVILGNVLDPVFLTQLIKTHAVEAVIHLAARTQVGESVREPWLYYHENINGLLAVLKALSNTGVRNLVFASSAAVYGDPEQPEPIAEAGPLKPINPYGFTKLMGEQVLRDVATSMGLACLAFRYFNVAGQAKDWGLRKVHPTTNLIFPLLARVGVENREISSLEAKTAGVLAQGFATKDGTCVRDYVHAKDIAHAHVLGLNWLAAHSNSSFFEAVNLGTNQATSLRQVVNDAQKIGGRDFGIEWKSRPEGFPTFLVANHQKAKTLLGWEPKLLDPLEIMQSEWDYAASYYPFNPIEDLTEAG